MLAWWLLHRWWFMSGDDYLLITQAGDVAGRFSFGDWLRFLAHEWAAPRSVVLSAIRAVDADRHRPGGGCLVGCHPCAW